MVCTNSLIKIDGRLVGMTENEAVESLATMAEMAKELSATISVIRERVVNGDRKVMEVLIRKTLSVKGIRGFVNCRSFP
jgi:GTPase